MRIVALLISGIMALTWPVQAQEHGSVQDTLLHGSSLADCVQYALAHRPLLRQARLGEDITREDIAIRLSDWLPHLTFSAYVQRNTQPPLSLIGGAPVPTLLPYSSSGQFTASQILFDRDVLLAASTAGELRQQSADQTERQAIDVIVNVSKAFYAVLLTQEQIALIDEDIVRLAQSLKDARSQYESGVVDKIDYERASIALNSARSEKFQTEELLKARYDALRQQMGYPPDEPIVLTRDTTGLEQDIALDTTRTPQYASRIEYQLLHVQKKLLQANVSYNAWSFFPSLSLYGSLNYNYQDSRLPSIFSHNFPSSWFGVQLTLPILEGGKRIFELNEAKMELRAVQYDLDELQQSINAEYSQAMAQYKGSLNNYNTLRQNVSLAEDVYKTVQLQYEAGTKAYLEVITAESDLRTAETDETDALYQVLSSKLDVLRSLGAIHD